MFGHHVSIIANHVQNGGGVQVYYQSPFAYVAYNTVENLASDGMGQKSHFGIFEYNTSA